MRILLLTASLISLIFSAALAQDEGLSELDILSRGADDPFAGVLDREEREPVSVTLRALDKITARYTDIEIEMNQIARFGSLEIQPRFCDTRPPEEFPETTAFLEIFDLDYGNRESDLKPQEEEVIEDEIASIEIGELPVEPTSDLPSVPEGEIPEVVLEGPKAEGINIFRGWMFASSPALNALEHPVYDVWVIDCKTEVVSD
ncbi:MAG: DUF2155 domain-containing protein [Marinicaulis sp.]|nr:DUF2155 domain-containing protein [Marinicaulis sp.]NNE41767.1 DUF2155 domain-containing protein [Marinicaulis sp.]NNL89411.1 DUF2155 domain-containing protein [Marinicaulis sp.]